MPLTASIIVVQLMSLPHAHLPLAVLGKRRRTGPLAFLWSHQGVRYGIPGRMGGRRLDIWTGQAVRHAISSFHHISKRHVPSSCPSPLAVLGTRRRTGPLASLWSYRGGRGVRYTWEDGREKAGPLYDDAGHVQHQLDHVSQAASRTRLGTRRRTGP
jgi:hypothetical protein